jgi:hypothetical protein
MVLALLLLPMLGREANNIICFFQIEQTVSASFNWKEGFCSFLTRGGDVEWEGFCSFYI